MVDLLRSLKHESNTQQKEYLANVFVVSGGAIMFTAWQEIFPLTMDRLKSFETCMEISALMIISLYLVYLGYNIQEDVHYDDNA